MTTAEQVGGWIGDGFVWLIWGAACFVGAAAAAALVIGVGTVLAWFALAYRDDLRRRREAAQRAYRDWCDSHEWCSYHDRPDGHCPRIEVVHNPFRYPDDGPRFVDCGGSRRAR